MEPTPQRGNSGFTLGGFLILAALGTFIWKGAPLESVRPSSEQSGWYEHRQAQQVPARLWQDPFKAVYAHEQVIKSSTATIGNYNKKPDLEAIEGFHNKDSVVDLTLLMVLVTPGSYAVLEERRRRHRYAVLSGLGEEHFVPRNAETLNVFYLPKTNRAGSCSLENEGNHTTGFTPFEECYSVPYEWYDYENSDGKRGITKQVLVLWLDESQFVDSPLSTIKNFIETLLPSKRADREEEATLSLLNFM